MLNKCAADGTTLSNAIDLGFTAPVRFTWSATSFFILLFLFLAVLLASFCTY